MTTLNTVSADGTCNKCSKKVNGNDVCCIICKVKFHATGCSNDIDICTQSFLNQFKPHVDKVSPKYAARPGNFMFMCDPCKTTFEIKSASKEQSKVDVLEDKVGKLENGLEDIKNLLLNKYQGEELRCNGHNSCHTLREADNTHSNGITHDAWGGAKAGIEWPIAAPLLKTPNIVQQGNHVDSTSALILPATKDESSAKQQVKMINKVAIERKVSIAKSFKKKNGDTVIVCNTRESRDSLKNHIENAVPDIEVVSSNGNFKYTIAVVGFDDDNLGNNIVNTLVDQSYFLNAFFANERIDDHIKYIDAEVFQATFKVSKDIRKILKNHGDRVIVGITSCKVYDRVFPKRCATCQNYGHFFAQCPCKDEPFCALCGKDHETINCPTPDLLEKKCINCMRNKLDNANHAATSTHCPIFKKELAICTQKHAASLN